MKEERQIMHCLVCDRKLEVEDDQSQFGDCLIIFPVYDGVLCRVYGNYGSTKYDPLNDDEVLHFVICDDCLVKKADKIQREQFVKLALAPGKVELKVKVREPYSRHRARFSDFKEASKASFMEEEKKCLANKEHFWLPVPKNGRFICHICGKIIDEEYIYQLEHFKQVWNGTCHGSKEAREEIEEEREWRECILKGKAFEFWNDPEEEGYTLEDGDPPENA